MVDLISALGSSAGHYASQSQPLDVDDVFGIQLYRGNNYISDSIDTGVEFANSAEYAVYTSGEGEISSQGKTVSTTDFDNNVYLATVYPNNILVVRKYSKNYQSLSWEKYYQFGSNSNAHRMYYSDNGNLYLSTAESSTPILMRLNPSTGAIIWQKNFVNSNTPNLKGIEEDSNGTYVYVVGQAYTASIGTGTKSGMISKLAVSNGSPVWDKAIYNAGSQTQALEDLTILNGNIFVCGYLWTGNYARATIVKINTDGVVQRSRQFYENGTQTDTRLRSITNDGTNIYTTGGEPACAYIIKANENLDTFTKIGHTFGNESPRGQSIQIGSDDKLYVVFAGDTKHYFNSPPGYVIATFDKSTLALTSSLHTRRFITDNGTINSVEDVLSGKGSTKTLNWPGWNGQYSYAALQVELTDILNLSSSKYLKIYTQAGANNTLTITDDNITTNAAINTDGSWSDSSVTVATSLAFTANFDTHYEPEVTNAAGGLAWVKARETSTYPSNYLFNTEDGFDIYYRSDQPNAFGAFSANVLPFPSSRGFELGDAAVLNQSGIDYVTWMFRQAPKFFDIVTYNGSDITNPSDSIPHNLGCRPGLILIKARNASANWGVWHRGSGTDDHTQLSLNSNEAAGSIGALTNSPDENVFYPYYIQDHLANRQNNSSNSYIAYIFAHNDSDGNFGPNGDQDIIKCGGYTGNGDSAGNFVELGFEPQFLLIKRTNGAQDWWMLDTARKADDYTGRYLFASSQANEGNTGSAAWEPKPTGFSLRSGSGTNGNLDDYIYMAIRKGSLYTPTQASDVFAVQQSSNDGVSDEEPEFTNIGFAPDLGILKSTSGSDSFVLSRGIGQYQLRLNSLEMETSSTYYHFEVSDGYYMNNAGTSYYSWMWKRAPGFFEQVLYEGNNVNTSVRHGLGVPPEMMIVKARNSTNTYWKMYHKDANGGVNPEQYSTTWITQNRFIADSTAWNNTAPDSERFYLGTDNMVNNGSWKFLALLWATVPGVSKVGSFTMAGSAVNVDCGFTSGARFVLVKGENTGSNTNFMMFDTKRGITIGTDSRLDWNTSSAQSTTNNVISPNPIGFTAETYLSNGNYVFYAVA